MSNIVVKRKTKSPGKRRMNSLHKNGKETIPPPTEEELAALIAALDGLEEAVDRVLLRMDDSHELLQDCIREFRAINHRGEGR